jgi:hypothetical protein
VARLVDGDRLQFGLRPVVGAADLRKQVSQGGPPRGPGAAPHARSVRSRRPGARRGECRLPQALPREVRSHMLTKDSRERRLVSKGMRMCRSRRPLRTSAWVEQMRVVAGGQEDDAPSSLDAVGLLQQRVHHLDLVTPVVVRDGLPVRERVDLVDE